MEITIDAINALIEERKQCYRDVNNAVPAYNRERQLSRDYNGRQILELIQNADDEGATCIDINIDTVNKELTITNNGNPFSFEGIRSIMIADYSSKVTSTLIGNKGLGFRSLLVWANAIRIETGDLAFVFSTQYAKELAKRLGLDLDTIRRERNLTEDCCPFPVLSIPEVESIKPIEKGCRVIIDYKTEYEQKVIEQAQTIDEKTLLFLRNVKILNCTSYSPGKQLDIHLSLEKTGEFRVADGQRWLLVSDRGELPKEYQDSNNNEKQCYEVTLALPQGAAQEAYLLYNYLPTQEQISLPFIIHATLDLDSSRNHLVQNARNEYVLSKIIDLLADYCQTKLVKNEACNWDLYAMMTPRSMTTSDIIMKCFFGPLIIRRDGMKIFPTVSGDYVKKSDYYYRDNADSDFWFKFAIRQNDFARVLIPAEEWISSGLERHQMEQERLIESINDISKKEELCIEYRAELIRYIARHRLVKKNESLSILIDNENTLIQPYEKTFTPKTEGVSYDTPSFVRIHFINRPLYDELIKGLRADELLTDGDNLTRDFCAVLRDCNVAKVSDYDKDQVIREIISQTNEYLKSDDGNTITIIQEMVRQLYNIYRTNGFETVLEGVQLLDQKNELKKASELLFDTEDNKYIFGEGVDYLATNEVWSLEEYEPNYQRFFRLLGVNRLIVKSTFPNWNSLWHYSNWLEQCHEFSGTKPFQHDCMNNAMCNARIIQMSNLLKQHVEAIPLNKLVYLFSIDDKLYQQVEQRRSTLSFQFRSLYHADTDYSYLRYQFLSLPKVKMQILPGEVALHDTFDVADYPTETSLYRRTNILAYLTTNMRGITENEIAKMINELADRNYSFKNIRKVYKAVIEMLSKDNRTLKGQNIRLCATDNDGKPAYYPIDQIYYTDNISVPRTMIQSLGKKRLYYGARQGADKLCYTFGIQPLSEWTPQVIANSIEWHALDAKCSELVNDIKPYVLLYCIQNLVNMTAKQSIASRLKLLQIRMVKQCRYLIEQRETELKTGEFIQDGNVFYVNVSGMSTVSELQSSVELCNVFAEILSIVCKLDGKNDIFIRLFQNLEFMKECIRKEYVEEDLAEAFSLLGISTEELSFWQKVLGRTDSPSQEQIYIEILKKLGKESFPFEKVDFVRWNTTQSIELLCALADHRIDVWQLVDLSFYHQREIDEQKRNLRKSFEHALWVKLSKSDQEAQKDYLSTLNLYDGLTLSYDIHRLYSLEEYQEKVKEEIKDLYDLELTNVQEEHTSMYPQYKDIIRDLPMEYQSLAFFENNEEAIQKEIDKLNEDSYKEGDSSFVDVLLKEENSSLTFLTVGQMERGTIPEHQDSRKRKRKPLTNAHKRALQNEQLGKRAEIIVRNQLKKKGYEYKWCSSFSDEGGVVNDAIGYDFEYKLDGEWRFLEVKSFNNGCFHISEHEYEISQNEDYKGRYDVALVCGDEIKIIQNFFSGDYVKVSDGYIVYCKLK